MENQTPIHQQQPAEAISSDLLEMSKVTSLFLGIFALD